ncbi:MAG: P1 family peptidase [Deltaproteobacteria bacterium]|nr:P1 family peptidase [Candidatus Zymogenaceae bacterium]
MGAITDIDGILLGHATDEKHHTGTTVLVCERPMPCGVDVRGGAPGTRETDVFLSMNLVETADAVVLSGGSAFGLDTASGVMAWLKEEGRGMDTGYGIVPLVPAAVIFDLPVSKGAVHPDADMGYRAAKGAVSGDVPMGNVGAGSGATVGKLYGMEFAVKSGIGTASVVGAGGVVVGAVAAVNALGDVIDPETGRVIAGTLNRERNGFVDARKVIHDVSFPFMPPGTATIIGVVAVNVSFGKTDMNRIARMAHDGLARAVFPSHTMLDGDTIFAVAAGGIAYADVSICGTLANEAMSLAVIDAVKKAESIEGYPAIRDL